VASARKGWLLVPLAAALVGAVWWRAHREPPARAGAEASAAPGPSSAAVALTAPPKPVEPSEDSVEAKGSARAVEPVPGADRDEPVGEPSAHTNALALRRARLVHGTVRWPDGEPVRSLKLDCGPVHYGQIGASFEFGLPDDGPYALTVSSTRGESWGRASARDVVPGAVLELVLIDGPVLRIEVKGADERPLARFAVELEGPGDPRPREWGQDGSARIPGLLPGSWTIAIHAFGNDAQRRTIAYPEDAGEVQRFELQPAPRASGIVLDPDGLPRAGAVVFVDAPLPPSDTHTTITGEDFSWSPSPREVECDGEGRFELEIESGGIALRAKDRSHATSSPLVVRASASDSPQDLELRLRPACGLSARAVDASGVPSNGWLRVTLDDGLVEALPADDGGGFEWSHLPAGHARLELWRRDAFPAFSGTPLAEAEAALDPFRPAWVELRVPAKD